jgi:Flp pilus assembly protein TadG
VVEFAVVAPLLFLTILLPIFEFGRAFMVSELVTNAARSGCRVGVLTGNTNTSVTSAVNSALSNGGITGATTTITVNGNSVDVSTASSGDSIAVTVSIPYSSVSWVHGQFLSGVNLTGTMTMRHE